MDEAIQCDFITYIAYGKKLIDGRAADIPSMIGLVTYRVSGPDITALEDELKREDAVEQVARFGSVLHVSSTDRPRLEAVIDAYRKRGTHEWVEKTSELEEAFIYLMAGARDNFARDVA